MNIKRLFGVNFLSIGKEPFELIIPDTNGLTLIRGTNHDVSQKSSNGSGKSTIVELILFVLYGKTLRKLNQDGIVHNDADGQCRTELEFDNVKIVRCLNPSVIELYIDGKRVGTNASLNEIKKDIESRLNINYEAMKNILIFGQHNMISFLDATEKEKREIIENLMNLAEYNGFEEKAKLKVRETKTALKIAQEAHTINEKHLTENIFLRTQQEISLQKYRDDIVTEIASIKLRLDKIPNMNFLREEWDRYHEAEKQKETLHQQTTSTQTQINDVVAKINETLSSRAKAAEEKTPLIDKRSMWISKKAGLSKKRTEIEQQTVIPLKQKLAEFDESLRELNSSYKSRIEAVGLSQNWEALINTAKREISEAEISCQALRSKKLNHNEQCPECFGTIDINNCANVLHSKEEELKQKQIILASTLKSKQEDIDNQLAVRKGIEDESTQKRDLLWNERQAVNQQIKDQQSQIDSQYDETLKLISDTLENINAEISAFDKNLDDTYGPTVAKLEDERLRLSHNFSTLERQRNLIAKVQKPQVTLEELAVVQTKAEEDKRKLADRNKALTENPYADIIDSLNQNIVKSQTELKNNENTIHELENDMPYYEYWVDAFGTEGIKSFVIDQIIPTLNKQIEYWLQIIYQGSISVLFDKFLDVKMINNASRNEMIFGQGSGGERRRIDIAVMLAFRQIMQMSCGKNPNIVFFDEVADNLDEDGITKLYDTLIDVSKSNRVFVITHSPTLLSLMQNAETINVQKKDGATTLVN